MRVGGWGGREAAKKTNERVSGAGGRGGGRAGGKDATERKKIVFVAGWGDATEQKKPIIRAGGWMGEGGHR